MNTGTLFSIKRYAIHDGPNIRTTVFFKGCPLACTWCHNPEGISPEIRVITTALHCIGCGACVEACPSQALTLSADGIDRNRSLCEGSGICVEVCPALAHEASGWQTDINAIMTLIKKDKLFFEQSNGGVTFSGGEPLMQPKFLMTLLKACGAENIHRTVDTCGFVETEVLKKVAKHTDLFLFDLKIMDSDRHRQFTGVPNELILENLRELSQMDQRIFIRFPLIPGINSDEENIRAMGHFITSLPNINSIDLLFYQGAAKNKYTRLEIKNAGKELRPPTEIEKTTTINILKEYGLKVRIGG